MSGVFRLYVPVDDHEDDGPTVPGVVESYLTHVAGRVDAGTFNAERYSSLAAELRSFAKENAKPVDECRQRDLVRWLNSNPSWKSIHTRKRVVGGVVSCFSWAADEEGGALIDFCPYKSLKSLNKEPYKPKRPADHGEYVKLMRFASRSLRRALFFLRRTGARTCEMRELTWQDVRIDDKNPHVLLYRHKTHRKTGKPRKFGLDAGTARWLRNLREASGGNGHVFRNCHGSPWTRGVFCKHMRRWCERLGLDDGVAERVSGYCLRHTYTCDGIEAGVTTRRIADQLGHKTTRMIDQIYGAATREREEHLADVAKEMTVKRKRKPTNDSTR